MRHDIRLSDISGVGNQQARNAARGGSVATAKRSPRAFGRNQQDGEDRPSWIRTSKVAAHLTPRIYPRRIRWAVDETGMNSGQLVDRTQEQRAYIIRRAPSLRGQSNIVLCEYRRSSGGSLNALFECDQAGENDDRHQKTEDDIGDIMGADHHAQDCGRD